MPRVQFNKLSFKGVVEQIKIFFFIISGMLRNEIGWFHPLKMHNIILIIFGWKVREHFLS